MDQNLLNEFKAKLEKEKENIEKTLSKFAKRDENLKGDWDTRFPHSDGESGSGSLEKEADEVEEYTTLLPIEHGLESKLKNIDIALEKMKRGDFGKCEKCGQDISQERLKAVPEARFCLKCGRK